MCCYLPSHHLSRKIFYESEMEACRIRFSFGTAHSSLRFSPDCRRNGWNINREIMLFGSSQTYRLKLSKHSSPTEQLNVSFICRKRKVTSVNPPTVDKIDCNYPTVSFSVDDFFEVFPRRKSIQVATNCEGSAIVFVALGSVGFTISNEAATLRDENYCANPSVLSENFSRR